MLGRLDGTDGASSGGGDDLDADEEEALGIPSLFDEGEIEGVLLSGLEPSRYAILPTPSIAELAEAAFRAGEKSLETPVEGPDGVEEEAALISEGPALRLEGPEDEPVFG